MNVKPRKRLTVKPKRPNPLFEKWLTEWFNEAKQNDSKMQFCFSTALKSLKKYPLPLESGKDCKILRGFGDKLCKLLDDKLRQHKTQGNTNVQPLDVNSTDVTQQLPIKKNKKNSPERNNLQEYIPQYRSGAFAILVALYEQSLEPGYAGHLTKNEIITHGQHLADASFTKPAPNTRYTGWSSMGNLLEKGLVVKQGNPAKFSLTAEGRDLGDRLYVQLKIEEFTQEDDTAKPTHSQSSCVPKKATTISRHASSSSTQSSSSLESVILGPNSFEIILLIDTQEVSGSIDDPIIIELTNMNVRHEVRNLKVGDYLWICHDLVSNHELVLPYIIERKRMDDLGSSIKDDRFHEQKFRLKQCGIPNLIYLIEEYGNNEHVGLPLNTLLQAATNTLIQDGFSVKFTENGKATCAYLACLTAFVTNMFKSKTLVSCAKEDLQSCVMDDDLVQLMHFKDFNKSSAKNKRLKVKDMFIKQLLQIKGLSVDRVLAIVDKYPTPKVLALAYSELAPDEGEKLLAGIHYGTLKKKVGPVLSKIVYQVYCKSIY